MKHQEYGIELGAVHGILAGRNWMQIISRSSSMPFGHTRYVGRLALHSQHRACCSPLLMLQVPRDAYVIVQGHYVEQDKPGLFVLEALQVFLESLEVQFESSRMPSSSISAGRCAGSSQSRQVRGVPLQLVFRQDGGGRPPSARDISGPGASRADLHTVQTLERRSSLMVHSMGTP